MSNLPLIDVNKQYVTAKTSEEVRVYTTDGLNEKKPVVIEWQSVISGVTHTLAASLTPEGLIGDTDELPFIIEAPKALKKPKRYAQVFVWDIGDVDINEVFKNKYNCEASCADHGAWRYAILDLSKVPDDAYIFDYCEGDEA